MMTGFLPAQAPLGAYLKDRRGRVDPAALGLPTQRRRTAGLRREEVALRANISPTWYTCLEQGRGGAPSADVLERIARALMLTEVEREHLFFLGVGRPPEARYKPDGVVTMRLQHVIEALDPTPALIRTATWDVVGWNRAAAAVLPPYASMPPEERNMLRHMFLNPLAREVRDGWEDVARAVVAEFRADAARAGAWAQVGDLVENLRRSSKEFREMWDDNSVRAPGGMVKNFSHPVLGSMSFEISLFSVDCRPDLTMITYHPSDPEYAAKIEDLLFSLSSSLAGW